MSDLIDRQEAIDILDQYAATLNPDRDNTELGRVDRIRRFIEQLPSTQSERKKGHWIESHEHVYMGNVVKEWINWYCSECDVPNDKPTDFCPSCGAYMVTRCFK